MPPPRMAIRACVAGGPVQVQAPASRATGSRIAVIDTDRTSKTPPPSPPDAQMKILPSRLHEDREVEFGERHGARQQPS